MKRSWQWAFLMAIAATSTAAPAWAAETKKPPEAQQSADQAPAVEPSAIHAIEAMAQKLRSLKTFSVTADISDEEVLETGQKVTYGGTVTYKIRAPDRLFAAVDSDRKERSFYYNGSQFTIYAPRMHYYASKPVTGTVAQLVQAAQEKYDIDLPLGDLFYWGTDKAPLSNIQAATVIGPSRIGKMECDHLLMRQAGVDWQVWISRQTLLPIRLVIANLDDPTQPEYRATFDWDTTTPLADSVFNFTPSQDDHPIKIGQGKPASEASP
ncbi:DUF2092 domain-containing protein [Dyella telluris]|uniref:DUF2092 domain-containing protein n=1 Tax=Dyella telluris TaxID=2763498 RepID=A0A7G8Q3B6_9GAMM|nr:DUF2092 domain-containing protein [Dyella telluris]QNK01274.1 DUF2092 domain-containing protein [Dyella telluris]